MPYVFVYVNTRHAAAAAAAAAIYCREPGSVNGQEGYIFMVADRRSCLSFTTFLTFIFLNRSRKIYDF
jgi:hypothetical protein